MYISPRELAEREGLTVAGVKRYLLAGEVKGAHKVGSRWLVPVDAVLVRKNVGRPQKHCKTKMSVRNRINAIATWGDVLK